LCHRSLSHPCRYGYEAVTLCVEALKW
jgi:hypothetical protein